MRYAVPIALALGLVIGIIATVMTMSALKSGPHMTDALMHMQSFHMSALDTNIKQNHCAVTDNLPHVQALRALSNDIEPLFLPVEKEADFRQKASNLRAALDAVLASPPADCATVGAALSKIGHECKACHDEFKH